jgi:hypothetical protein
MSQPKYLKKQPGRRGKRPYKSDHPRMAACEQPRTALDMLKPVTQVMLAPAAALLAITLTGQKPPHLKSPA